MGDLDDIGFPVETAKPKIFQVRVIRTPPSEPPLPTLQLLCCVAISQVMQNILGPTPFLQAKAGIWTTTIIENILKELKEINDESAKAGQHDEEMGQLWKFVGEATRHHSSRLSPATHS